MLTWYRLVTDTGSAPIPELCSSTAWCYRCFHGVQRSTIQVSFAALNTFSSMELMLAIECAPLSSGWSTSSVYWSTSASIKQLHHIWLRCVFLSQQPTTDVTSALQHSATWQFHESDWEDTEEEVSLCLVRCCGTHDLAVPRVRLARYGRSFSVSGPLL